VSFVESRKSISLKKIIVSEINQIDHNMTKEHVQNNGPAGAIYGLGLIGAAIYYISVAAGFWAGVLGFLKALVWPAFLVYELLKYLAA